MSSSDVGSSCTSSPRGTKRRRTNSPASLAETGPRIARRTAIEGVNSLVGSSRDLERDAASEPETEDSDSQDDYIVPRRQGPTADLTLDPSGTGSEEEGREPETEVEEEERRPPSARPGASTQRLSPNPTSRPPRISPAVLDLTDDNEKPLVFRSPQVARPPLPKPDGSSDDDDILFVTSQHQDKGKRVERAKSSPLSPSMPPVPAEPELPSLATLSCPICLGAPTPLALTSCGHAFCAPCLHAALVAGPDLTPPPPGTANAGGGRGGRGGARAGAGAGGRGGRGRSGRGGGYSRGQRAYVGGAGPDEDEAGDPELDKHCPVCRTPLYGGWGKSLRGLVVRMAPVKRN
ncbi:SUMO-targeted ubiquitin ligase complex subunit SLX8 [Sporobolomyces koalae]|uniref:SUMO-targeted ubiquitin ligase complex subunit SLX8 n=1 Tax=Sporobolomyces koalae TaxID=500713 RepID=UPI0031781F96